MNYLHHYNTLIERAKNRKLDTYTESHHIIPRCMSGTNTRENLVRLTPEEHYVAHQLLIKIYPDNRELIHAVVMMCISSRNHRSERVNNKLFGWLRRKLSKTVSTSQSGSGNSQYGKHWINNGIESKLVILADNLLPDNYSFGRIKKRYFCSMCEKESVTQFSKYCEQHQKYVKSANGKKMRYILDY